MDARAGLLSVVVPVYNERATIRETLVRLREVDLDLEIIVVDDGSTDGTRELLQDLEPEGLLHRLLVHDGNRGKGAALRSGLKVAAGEFLIIQDADLEYDPRDLPRLLQPILEGRADVVYGSRFVGSDPLRARRLWHSLANRFLTTVSNLFTNLRLTDMETCYKLFRREMLDGITLRENRFGVEPEITAKVSRIPGVRICEVGISYSGRGYSEGKKIGWRDGLAALWSILRYNIFSR